jgi:homocysteine S-methyltransferase
MTDEVLLLDGGLSTALEQQGFVVDGPLWTGELLLRDPEAVTRAHRTFVDAGADILITGSYQLSYEGGRLAGFPDDDITRALTNATVAARLACDEATLVAASVGPFGAHRNDGSEFHGYPDVSPATLREFHARRLEVLLESEPDLLAIETIPEFAEAEVILDLLDELDPAMPCWVSFTVRRAGVLSGGARFADACALVAAHDAAIAVGINCSPLEMIAPTLRLAESELPFVVYPNAGQSWDSESMAWSGAAQFATSADIAEWVALGARIIGGCCGYGPDHIATCRVAILG